VAEVAAAAAWPGPAEHAAHAAHGHETSQDAAPLSLEEARERILAEVHALPPAEALLADALRRVVAAEVRSLLTLPPWDNSAMDGFAVRSADVATAAPDTPVRLRVVGEAAAGHLPTAEVGEGTAVRVLTGGLLPAGADAVVPVEDTDVPPGVAALPEAVAVRVPAAAGRHVRTVGSDLRAGVVVLEPGATVTPAAVAVLAATGHASVMVHRHPRVAIVSTGDELVPVGEVPGPASIPDSNGESLAAQVRDLGAEAIRLGIARDDREDIRERLREGVAQADVVIASGGVSVGAHDLVKEALTELGELRLWRVAIQPGKPLAFGRTTAPDGHPVLLFGLPGNPVSSFVTFELFVRPAIRTLAGRRDPDGRSHVRAELDEEVQSPPGRRSFLRVRLESNDPDGGRYRARTAGGQGSHVLSALAVADGLAIVPEAVTSLPAGAEVEVIRLDVERW
jgi:molybdopterin molybdotransferase